MAINNPGFDQQYYLFTVKQKREGGNLLNACDIYWSVLDMRLDEGRGDIVTGSKNVLLSQNNTKGLTAIPHRNGRDYWLISHTMDNQDFYVYLVNEQGINPPQTYSIGSPHRYFFAYYKASPNGEKLACALGSDIGSEETPFEMFNFDAEEGKITNPVYLGSFYIGVSASFSPNNTKLYLNGLISNDSLAAQGLSDIVAQFKVDRESPEAIRNSLTLIAIQNPQINFPNIGSIGFGAFTLEIAPNGKMYGGGGFGADGPLGFPNLIVINRPNAPGFNCDLNLQAFDFGANRTVRRGLPNQIQNLFNGLEPESGINDCRSENVSIFPNPSSDGIYNLIIDEACGKLQAISLNNALGQEISLEDVHNTIPDKLDIRYLANGVYFITLYFDNNKIIKKVHKLGS
ncbi:MAG: T9SS type A sorting domain-containing protein [Bacteroidia bacterium]|nr:T9SS type A sorting domain-containing protein [Bacteroidia bacterium]